jgi:hypothetical protein
MSVEKFGSIMIIGNELNEEMKGKEERGISALIPVRNLQLFIDMYEREDFIDVFGSEALIDFSDTFKHVK